MKERPRRRITYFYTAPRACAAVHIDPLLPTCTFTPGRRPPSLACRVRVRADAVCAPARRTRPHCDRIRLDFCITPIRWTGLTRIAPPRCDPLRVSALRSICWQSTALINMSSRADGLRDRRRQRSAGYGSAAQVRDLLWHSRGEQVY